MELVRIGASGDVQLIKNRMDFELSELLRAGVRLRGRKERSGDMWVLKYASDEPMLSEHQEALVHFHIANALSDIIVNNLEAPILNKLVQSHYDFFDPQEQGEILKHALVMVAEDDTDDQGFSQRILRKNLVMYRISEYLSEQSDIILEGFLNFRLRDYLGALEAVVDRAVDNYLLDREHQEFIELLQCLLESQEPRLERVHAVISARGSFKLVDSQENTVEDKYLEEFVCDLGEADINYDDLLISSLVTVSPRQLVIHCPPSLQNSESVKTIMTIFGDRGSLCEGCKLCRGPGKDKEKSSD